MNAPGLDDTAVEVPPVFRRLVGQRAILDDLVRAAVASRTRTRAASAMTHAWLFTGPPGSGRSVAARCFAAALECQHPEVPGCGRCRACTTVLSGTHADVRHVVPDGLSIPVKTIREIVAAASRAPSTGRWQIVVIEDADRLTESAANALLKVVEEPPESTVFLLCAPSIDPEDVSVTIRSRCRHVALTMPRTADVARVLIDHDGIDPEMATWAASVAAGHVGRARRLATDPEARAERVEALGIARAATRDSTAYEAAERLVARAKESAKTLTADLDVAETEELRTALGAGGTGKGTAGALRGSAGVLKALEQKQKSRVTRVERDSLDRTLVDLAGLFRDALTMSWGGGVELVHPDMSDQTSAMARYAPPESLLACVETVLRCREALDTNVKPRFAVDAMIAEIGLALRR
ncbi:DNA polymerase III subunit delta' [Gordonia jinhuaensis]|uniref:DNA polymerase III subunit delta n=1 Tax=Gordonia jinhuaensis TaxID=1517702 RepID=A0A916T8P2_9ACTN|nr:DNA polymerase III subunit delta' [Gordonia jinhuaensis]